MAADAGSATIPSVSVSDIDWSALRLSAGALERARHWLDQPRYHESRAELAVLLARGADGDKEALDELEDAFACPLPIGTGGRRGKCGPGDNRFNAAVVRETVQGLVDALLTANAPRSAVVVYDTRRDSRMFAGVVAQQLAANDVDVLVVDAPRPTPQLSFLVRMREAGVGVVISASHNPPEDNGIKLYDYDGAQVLGERDRALMAAIEALWAETAQLPAMRPEQGQRITWAADEAALAALDEPYRAFVADQGVLDGDLSATGLSVVFTPLHGVGHTSVVPTLRQRGVDVTPVAAQCDPDKGRFSTVSSANPEVPESMAMAEALAEERGADLVLATDPDADRLGAMARHPDGGFRAIDGNRLGVLLLDHVLRHGGATPGGWVLTTLVTSPLIATLARAAGVEVVDDLLVGFKHHAGMMREQPERPLIFACEESHGYLRGSEVRDKDGAVAALLLVECAAELKRSGQTLFDRLAEIWRRDGYHRERTANIFAPGIVGRRAIDEVMEHWRRRPPGEVGGLTVVGIDDRASPKTTPSPTRNLPGNVLAVDLEDRAQGTACRLVLRPSGTEPKLKLYALARGKVRAGAGGLAETMVAVDALVDRVVGAAQRHAESVMASVERA